MADLLVENHGSIFLLDAVTVLGREWIADHIPKDAMWFGGAVVVEHRYVAAIVAGATVDIWKRSLMRGIHLLERAAQGGRK